MPPSLPYCPLVQRKFLTPKSNAKSASLSLSPSFIDKPPSVQAPFCLVTGKPDYFTGSRLSGASHSPFNSAVSPEAPFAGVVSPGCAGIGCCDVQMGSYV